MNAQVTAWAAEPRWWTVAQLEETTTLLQSFASRAPFMSINESHSFFFQ